MIDAVERALLAQAGDPADGRVVAVLDAVDLAAELAAAGHRVRGHVDSAAERDAVADAGAGADWCDDPADAVAGAHLVLGRLDKALAALDDTAGLVARGADPGVRLAVAARNQHLRHAMNDVLRRYFAEVSAARGVGKARALLAAEPSPGAWRPYPRTTEVTVPGRSAGVRIAAHGRVFAQGRLDAGTATLLDTRDRWPDAGTIVDLGSGDGVLAAVAAMERPDAQVVAVDDSWAACRSTAATALANGVGIEVRHADGLTGLGDGTTDLIVSNPPFHHGTAKDSTPAMIMLADAGRVLRRGGELWCVYNAHLPYLPWLRRHVGRTDIMQRTRDYLVTRSIADL